MRQRKTGLTSPPQIGIGADTNLYSRMHKARAVRTLNQLRRAHDRYPLRAHWLDVGAGPSHMRAKLEHEFAPLVAHVSDVNLDLEPYPYPDNYFETITHFEVIEHLFNPLFHMQELRRILSPSGNLFLTTPNDCSLIYKAEHLLSRKYRPHFHQFSTRDLEDLCGLAGFRIIDMHKFFKSASGTIARISRNGIFLHAKID